MKERNKVANVFTDIAPKWNDKDFRCGSCSYVGSMTKMEEKEYINVMMLMGI